MKLFTDQPMIPKSSNPEMPNIAAYSAVSRKLEFPLTDAGARFADASTDFKFAAAVAEFGMILRDSPHKGNGTLADVLTWAQAGSDNDDGGYRAEFIRFEIVR